MSTIQNNIKVSSMKFRFDKHLLLESAKQTYKKKKKSKFETSTQ